MKDVEQSIPFGMQNSVQLIQNSISFRDVEKPPNFQKNPTGNNVRGSTVMTGEISKQISSIYNYDNLILRKKGDTHDEKKEKASRVYYQAPKIGLSIFLRKDIAIRGGRIYKSSISKIYEKKNQQIILITYNITGLNTNRINLSSFYDVCPCKNHVQGGKTGYFFIYDNKGKIGVFIGSFSENIEDKQRRIYELEVEDKRLDPKLIVIEQTNDQSVLLVIGGYIPSQKIIATDIIVFSLSLLNTISLREPKYPIFTINLKFRRLNPIV